MVKVSKLVLASKDSLNGYHPLSEAEIKQKLDKLIKKQSEELMAVILEEEKKEEERNTKLNQLTDPSKREKLDQEFGILRGMASERIKKLAKKHERNVVQLEKKLRGIN